MVPSQRQTGTLKGIKIHLHYIESMIDISLKSQLIRSNDLIATEMDGDIVMLNISTGLYYGVSGVGTRIWELLERPTNINELVQIISREYEVDEETCQKDLQVFLQDLLNQGAIGLC